MTYTSRHAMELLQDRVERDKARIQRMANPQPTSEKESRKRAKALLIAVLDK
jgi:hypothetical protein